MKDKRTQPTINSNNLLLKLLVVISLFIVVVLIVAESTIFKAVSAIPNYTLPLTVQPPATCGYCQDNLVGLTAEEIGNKVLSLANSAMDPIGASHVLKVRTISWEDAPALNVGCLADPNTIEAVPMALVVIEGNFDPGRYIPGYENKPLDARRAKYLSIVVDLWANAWISVGSSNTIDIVKAALEDKPLVKPNPWPCRERLVSTRHYGTPAVGQITVSDMATAQVRNSVGVPGMVPTIPVPASEIVPHEIPTTLPLPTAQPVSTPLDHAHK